MKLPISTQRVEKFLDEERLYERTDLVRRAVYPVVLARLERQDQAQRDNSNAKLVQPDALTPDVLERMAHQEIEAALAASDPDEVLTHYLGGKA